MFNEDFGNVLYMLLQNDLKKFYALVSSNMKITHFITQNITNKEDELVKAITIGIEDKFFFHFTTDGIFQDVHLSSGNWPVDEEYYKKVMGINKDATFKEVCTRFLDYYYNTHSKEKYERLIKFVENEFNFYIC